MPRLRSSYCAFAGSGSNSAPQASAERAGRPRDGFHSGWRGRTGQPGRAADRDHGQHKAARIQSRAARRSRACSSRSAGRWAAAIAVMSDAFKTLKLTPNRHINRRAAQTNETHRRSGTPRNDRRTRKLIGAALILAFVLLYGRSP